MNRMYHKGRKSSNEDSSFTVQQAALMAVVFLALVLTLQAQPTWWTATGGPLDSNPANDYAVANQGQLKQFTQKAVQYMNTNLPSGAGTNLNNMVAGWSNYYATNGYSSTNPAPQDFRVINQGQLKYIGNLVWTNLVTAGYTNSIPTWLIGTNANDYVAMNLGQIKAVFNFDLTADTDGNKLPDWWEMHYFGQIGNNTNATPNGSTTTVLYDYQHGISPFNFYGTVPIVKIHGGDNQSGPAGTALPDSFTVQVVDQGGTPYAGVAIQFSVVEGNGTLGGASSATVTTDSGGLASVFFAPGSASVANMVFATVTFPNGVAPGVIFTSYTTTSSGSGTADPGGAGTAPITDSDPPLASSETIAHLTIETTDQYLYPDTYTSFDMDFSSITLSWDPPPSGSDITRFQIERKFDDNDWVLIHTTANATENSYEDDDLLANQKIKYRVTPIFTWGSNTYSGASIEAEWEVPLLRALFGRVSLSGSFIQYYEFPNGHGRDPESFSFYSAYEPIPGNIVQYYYTFYPAVNNTTYRWIEWAQTLDISTGAPGTGSLLAAREASLNSTTTQSGTYTIDLSALGVPPTLIYLKSILPMTAGHAIGSEGAYVGSPGLNDGMAEFLYASIPYESANVSASGSSSLSFNSATGLISVLDPTLAGTITVTGTLAVSGTYVGSQSQTFTYTPPTVPPQNLNVPVDDASGALYRKIALNGRPLPDSKPQTAEESDQQPEETFIDAMTLGLRHSTTDAYIPVPGSELSLSARRNVQSEVWRMRSGLRPHERPDMPFGVAWNSNLCATIKVEQPSNDLVTAAVTDENGASYRFADTGEISSGVETWYPFPTAKNEQQTYLSSLSFNSSTNYFTFKRKFGSTLVYEKVTASGMTQVISSDRNQARTSNQTIYYARLLFVTDRLGQTVNYHYASDTSLIPDTISVVDRPDLTLSIYQEPIVSGGPSRITAIWDAKGNETQFGYTHDSTNNIDELTTVTTPDGQVTHYTYEIVTEPDLTPRDATDTYGFESTHCDVASIQDPNGSTYSFSYSFDHDPASTVSAGAGVSHAKWAYKHDPTHSGYYPSTGNPRMVHVVTLPSSTGTVTFTNQSNIKLVASGSAAVLSSDSVRQTQVTDAAGYQRTYTWSNPEILDVSQSLLNLNQGNHPKIILYQTMTLTYAGGSGTLGTETFNFDPDAGLALSSVTDFSGNTTTYTHGDTFAVSLPGGITWPTVAGVGSSSYNGHFDDPTAQVRTLSGTTVTKSFTYNSQRIMQSVTDEDGHTTTYTIDSLGRRTQEQISSSGTTTLTTSFTYSSTYPGFITQKIVGTGTGSLITSYVPDSDGNGRVAQEIVDPSNLNLTTTYTYDANGNKLSAQDPNGHTTSFAYDRRNRLSSVTYADGSGKIFAYDARGNKIMESDENGVATLYAYDSLNRLVTTARDMNHDNTIDSGDLITTYAYNLVNSKVSVTDPNGHATTLTYDELQRPTSTTDALSHTTTFVYGTNSGGSDFDSTGFKPTQVTDPRGYITNITYDSLYHATNKSVEYRQSPSALYSTSYTTYDALGNLTSSTDPLGNATTTTYDALNRPVTTTYADGSTTVNAYTATGLLSSVTQTASSTSHVTSMWYDTAGRRTTVTSPDGGVTTTGFDAVGNATSVTDPRSNVTTTAYDARNRPTLVTQPTVPYGTGSSTGHPVFTTDYDAAGNVTAKKDANGNITRMEYDAANRVIRTIAPLVPQGTGPDAQPMTRTTYDPVGNVLTVTDPRGEKTTNTYDALNRLLTSTDAAGIIVTNTYDEVGNKLTVQDGLSHTTTFTYDGLNRNLTQSDPASHAVTYTYDGLNKTKRVDALSHETDYAYDSRNRLTGVVYVSRTADNRTYAYDGFGNLTSVTEPNAATTAADVVYTYDANNRVLTEKSNGQTHTYTYDLAGNRTQTAYGGTSRTIVSSYDALNRLSQMVENTSRTTSYAYDLNGNIVKKTLPNGDKEVAVFDALNRASSQTATTGSGASLYTFGYAYDLDSNVARVTETYPSGLGNRTVTNSYDPINRLTSEVAAAVPSGGSVTTAYAYDAGNNRTGMTVTGGSGAGTTNYHYNSLNQLTYYDTGARHVAFTYDNNGNRATRVVTGGSDNGTDTSSYDYENRLVSLVKGSGTSTGTYTYTYDYRTRRVVRDESSAGGAITHVVFSGGTSVQEYDGATPALTVEYIRGSDYGGGVGGILYTTRSGTFSYTHENKRGDVVAKTSTTGTVTTLTYQAQYEAFGKQTATTGSTSDRQKSNSKDTDPTGLVCEGFRYRDLETGMFTTRDPAGFVDGPNLYTYVAQNPWTHFDPEGLTLNQEEDSPVAEPTDPMHPENDLVGGGYGNLWNSVSKFFSKSPAPATPSTAPAAPRTAPASGAPPTPPPESAPPATTAPAAGGATPVTKPDAKPIDSTRPQHGTDEHDATAFNDALSKQNTPGNTDARFNQQLTNTKGEAIPGYKPDSQVNRTLPDGSQVKDVTEVRSPSQDARFMDTKIEALKKALGKEAGDVKWIEPTPGATRNIPPPASSIPATPSPPPPPPPATP